MNIDLRSLLPRFFKLSKSSIIKGMQCERYLYLLKHKPKEKTPHDLQTLQKFAQGRDFEILFKDTFPNGYDVASYLKKDVWSIGASYTQAIIEKKQAHTLFEACFLYDSTLVMADVCNIFPDGSFDIYEVKNGLEAKDVFIQDMAIQYYIIKNALPGLKNFHLVLNDGADGFLVQDMTTKLSAFEDELKELITSLLQILKGSAAPKIAMGDQCHLPYDCEYIAYCNRKNN